MNLLDVLGIVRVNQCAHGDKHVACADILFRQSMCAGAIEDRWHIVILVDHLHRHEALARIGERNRDRAGIEIEHRLGIERVTIHTNDVLLVDRDRLAAVDEPAEAAILHHLPI